MTFQNTWEYRNPRLRGIMKQLCPPEPPPEDKILCLESVAPLKGA